MRVFFFVFVCLFVCLFFFASFLEVLGCTWLKLSVWSFFFLKYISYVLTRRSLISRPVFPA